MTNILKSWLLEGHLRISELNTKTNESRIVVDRKNTIMDGASNIIARALAGLPNSGISHLYLAYSNDSSVPGNGYSINKADPVFVTGDASNYHGCLRIPLSFAPAITDVTDEPGSKLMTFNILVNQPGGFTILDSDRATLTSGVSDFFEVGLVSQTNPAGSTSNITGDLVLARLAFQKLTYNTAFNLTISWGIKLTNV